MPLCRGETPADWRTSLYYHYYEFPVPHPGGPHYGVITDRFKLVHYYKPDVNDWELLDREKDPLEVKDFYKYPAHADGQGNLLRNWIACGKKSKETSEPPRAAYGNQPFDGEPKPPGPAAKNKAKRKRNPLPSRRHAVSHPQMHTIMKSIALVLSLSRSVVIVLPRILVQRRGDTFPSPVKTTVRTWVAMATGWPARRMSDAVAAKGMLFKHAWSTAPVCAPARTAIISGSILRASAACTCGRWCHMPPARRCIRSSAPGRLLLHQQQQDRLQPPRARQGVGRTSAKAHWKNRPSGKPFFAIFNSTKSHESQNPHPGRTRTSTKPADVRIPAYHPDTPEVAVTRDMMTR